MNKTILTLAMTSALFLTSCNDTAKKESTDVTTTTESVDQTNSDQIIKTTSTDKNGKTLDLAVDPIKGLATVNFNGETIELVQEKSASGIWFKNDTYELRGKGNDLELTKDGKVVFEHTDDKVNLEAKNDKGDVLTMDFNNSDGTVKAYLNGGDQIDLEEEKAASGIWYKNDHYELRGKADQYELTKDGKTVFKN
ncbi:hypothetical protein Q73A0000_01045 [Kaistella flava (ex Peng et al. 2021)]|uniref:C-type lysozyme inhibitor domain-containing protein n=1 Tax=Kaistella flava (ex Peng et al. 2021) TaxID=2038776 RepID=A0A7M2Y6H7_9FLAO|nr:MliC family protein [Kaistella flava (ex Peng et al. 2021)]QOW09032.1 hypothetical protein Q73A0000_01045 [Kaistella flava (ex Peng et al. 2021)]